MSTLLLRFAAPLQAWGTESKYDIRKTDREPSGRQDHTGFTYGA